MIQLASTLKKLERASYHESGRDPAVSSSMSVSVRQTSALSGTPAVTSSFLGTVSPLEGRAHSQRSTTPTTDKSTLFKLRGALLQLDSTGSTGKRDPSPSCDTKIYPAGHGQVTQQLNSEKSGIRRLSRHTQNAALSYSASSTVSMDWSAMYTAKCATQQGHLAAQAAAQAAREAFTAVSGSKPPPVHCDINFPIWWAIRNAGIVPFAIWSPLASVPRHVTAEGCRRAGDLESPQSSQRGREAVTAFSIQITMGDEVFSSVARPTASDQHAVGAWHEACVVAGGSVTSKPALEGVHQMQRTPKS
jgi:hypothetical protein